MRHLDLFSGIGGFALAAQQVWGKDYKCIAFCDNNPFCQAVLRKRFKGVPIYGDIRTLTADATGLRWDSVRPRGKRIQRQDGSRGKTGTGSRASAIDLLTGGFPCQPFSSAGKRQGKEDDRYLWPEMLCVIKKCKPRWIVGENVAGIVKMVLDQVFSDLEDQGYATQAFVVPACAVNAPHRRDRVWIVAYREHEGCVRRGRKDGQGFYGDQQAGQEARGATSRCDEDAFDTEPEGLQKREKKNRPSLSYVERTSSNASNAKGREAGPGLREIGAQQNRHKSRDENRWSQNWLEVATRFCGVDDGLPARMDGFELSKSKHREERIKALGNAIVPQVAVEIMRAIKETCGDLRGEGSAPW